MINRITASAPGSLMLLGEHAVLHGHLSVVCAINRRIRLTLIPRFDARITVQSALGRYETELGQAEIPKDFRFVMAAVRKASSRLRTGFDLEIHSEFSHTIGFGSSAAVTVATTAALNALAGLPFDRDAVFSSSRIVIRDVQGLGSGADAAASTYGGAVAYRAEPLEIEKLNYTHPLTAVYSGSKMPTAEVVRLVEERRKLFPQLFAGIFEMMDRTAMDAADAIQMQDWATLGLMLNVNQGLMDALGVNNAALARIVYALREDPGILGSKISGSGLGDCAIGLGRATRTDYPAPPMELAMQLEGVELEEA